MLFLYEQFLTNAAEGTFLTKPKHPSGKKTQAKWALGSKARLSHFKALSMLSLLMPHFCQKNAFA